MKAKQFFLAVLCLVGLSLVSCEKNNDPAVDITVKNLVGDWLSTYVNEVYSEGGMVEEEREDITTFISLYSDMTFLANQDGATGQGTWALQGDMIFLYISGVSNVGKFSIQKLTSTELVVREPWYEGNASGYNEYHFRRK